MRGGVMTTAEALDALREEARANAEALAEIDTELKPYFAEEMELCRAMVRTYPHRIGQDKFGGPIPFTAGYSRATDERLAIRAQLDAWQAETAPLRRQRKELFRLRGWYVQRIADLTEQANRPTKKPTTKKTKTNAIQLKML
jgi:hypothetical protein